MTGVVLHFTSSRDGLSSPSSWGRAGVRLTVSDQLRRRAAATHRRHQQRRDAQRSLEVAHQGWKLGLVAPWRITHALDAGNHQGPEVDIACGAEEPAVDEWEAGVRYPTFEQLTLLAELTGYAVDWFVRTDEPLDIRATTMWAHMTRREREQWTDPILTCADAAVEQCPGTEDYNATHLF
ncbi:hypothetical protein GS896_27710 [Rhodococcus hoagii]|nr:hypothetical protein [Prescottella equi]MBM4654040.1 hypothetical protein [Prescottella equi]MBM4719697.1 hypothetical protein [Prescottella equi]NKR23494.1 hypothetical protein [Prescottella equi]NKT56352.1 hypothetical protein [Prescottella equi]